MARRGRATGSMVPRSGVGPMQFGRSTIGWGASASPAAYAMGRAYGQLPRSRASGTAGGARRILNPWGNNIPKPGPNVNISRTRPGGRRMPVQSPDEIRIDYPANDPRQWPIQGGKIIQFAPAAKANFNNTVVNHAFTRGGYSPVVSPTYSGTDKSYAIK